MRILVASIFEASSQKAHVINTVKMAQGFARLGHEVTIICCQAPEGAVSPDKLAKIYGLTEPLRWVQLPKKILGYKINEYRWFALLALPFVLQIRPDLVYARNDGYPGLTVTSKYGIPTVAESHAHVGTNTIPFLRLVELTRDRAFLVWVTISHRLVDYYHSLGVPKDKLIVLCDAVDLKFFQRPEHLPPSPYSGNRANVAYVGHLYDYKGIPTVLETAAKLPDIHFHLVGGLPEDIDRQQKRAQELQLDNVTFHGLQPQVELPKFLWHADVLLLPPSQHHPSAAWTSPVKLGEYLASGTPIVATEILALRDWLTDDDVEFVEPDNSEALAKGIAHLLSNQQRAEQLRVSGLAKAQELSYEKRAQAILKYYKKDTSSLKQRF
ncbi:MAG: glycosyltransferase family 4 protein [Hydrococcus sp. C42_A2020_068]|nr:glycosyltransferase family 4 protein [Hydrococcus sp. C42_A2020_068]